MQTLAAAGCRALAAQRPRLAQMSFKTVRVTAPGLSAARFSEQTKVRARGVCLPWATGCALRHLCAYKHHLPSSLCRPAPAAGWLPGSAGVLLVCLLAGQLFKCWRPHIPVPNRFVLPAGLGGMPPRRRRRRQWRAPRHRQPRLLAARCDGRKVPACRLCCERAWWHRRSAHCSSGDGGAPCHCPAACRRVLPGARAGARALCALPHRLPARGRRAHRALQLAVCQERGRQDDPARGGHGRGAVHAGERGGGAHRPQVAGHRVGRG